MVMDKVPYRPGMIAPIASLVAAVFWVSACATKEPIDPAAAAEILVLTESLRIGDEPAGDTVYFDSVWDLAVHSEGNILVSDDSQPGFLVFTPDGTLIHEIGSEGEGPGEFEETPLLYVSLQDSVYAFDLNSDRLTVYSPGSYELSRTLSLSEARSSNARPTDVLAALPDMLVVQFEHVVPRDPAVNNDGLIEIKTLDLAGHILRDSLVMIPSMQRTLIEDSDISTLIPLPREFGRESFVVLGSDGVIHAGWTESIDITSVPLDGRTAGGFAVPHSPVPVTSEEKDSLSSQYLKEWTDQIRQDMPDTKPAFNSLVPDDEGRLWIRLSWSEHAAEAEWLVVEAHTGKVSAKTSLPVSAELMAIRQGRAYGTLDEGAEVVAVWKIGR